MTLEDKPTHYEVLEISPDASPTQIREAYLRVKATYGKDSVALYTLIDPNEREQMLRQIEEAYLTLSDERRRKDYDTCHGFIDTPSLDSPFAPSAPAPVVSIDRTPPMSSSPEDLLIPPVTAFDGGKTTTPFGHVENTESRKEPESDSAPDLFKPEPAKPAPTPPRPESKYPDLPGELAGDLENQSEWPGSILKRVREARRISIEELANVTKISKTYLFAIEEESFAKLPAPVFVRGFVSQITRALKLPTDDVVSAYMARFNRQRPEKK